MSDRRKEVGPKVLMQRAKEGDQRAFEVLYETYFVSIFRYLYFRVENKVDAEDLTQTVFLKIYSSLPHFQIQDKSPLPYFFTVARNTMIDYWRKKKDVSLDEEEEVMRQLPALTGDPREIVEKGERESLLHGVLDILTEEQREVIVLKFINDLSNEEISKTLGKSEAAVRQLQSRALKVLRRELKRLHIV